jgi:4'-phosphopantetheinyl transferase EntD
VAPFEVAYHQGMRHGVLAAVHLPDGPDPVAGSVLAQLPDAEAAHARTLSGWRQPQFVGGRLALRAAARQLGVALPAVLPDDRGAPTMPAPLVASVSHKVALAVALVARAGDHRIGVDLEEYRPPRPSIESAVLRPEEIEAVAGLPAERRWIATLQRFSVKEAVYKALDPFLRRYIGFHEASVQVDLDGQALVALHLPAGDGSFHVDARTAWVHGRIVSSVRIRPATIASASR